MSNIKHKLNEQDNKNKRSSFRSGLLKTQYKSLIGEFIKDVWKARSITNIDKHLSEDFVDHDSWLGSTQDLESWKKGFEDFCNSFSNYKFSLEKLISESDTVAIKYNIVIENSQNSPLTNGLNSNHIILFGVDMYRIARGKIAERWGLNINSAITQTQKNYN